MSKHIVARKGVFETNSSSTHSICVAKAVTPPLPKVFHFGLGEFGWEKEEYRSAEEKGEYLYTGLVCAFQARVSDLKAHMGALGVPATYKNPESVSDFYGFYVDHGGELSDFVEGVLASPQSLASYLFSDLSYIRTGNDNSHDWEDIEIQEEYAHDLYYKGN